MPHDTGAVADGLATPRRHWSALAIWLAIAMSVLDTAIANIALPTIARELGATPSHAIWVVNAYQIAITMTLLSVAALGEIVGFRRVYAVGLVLFVAASAGCTLAGGLASLSAWRFVQGFGAAAVMGVNGALVRWTYPRAMLGRGIARNALVVAIASAAGPTIAAAILTVASWRWLFAVNVPIGLLSLAIGLRALPDVPRRARRFDRVAALLNAAGFAAVFVAATDLAHGRAVARVLAEFAVAVLAFAALVRRERGEAAPLVPLDLIRVPLLRLSYLASICAFAAQMTVLVAVPFYVGRRFGLGHAAIGLMMTPWPLALAAAAPLSARLLDRVGAGALGAVGMGATAAGALAAAASVGPWPMAAALALCGAGFGLFQTPNNRIMLGAAPAERSGAAAGMQATARLVGQTLGAVAVALLFRLMPPSSAVPMVAAAAMAALAAVVSGARGRPASAA